MADSSNFAAGPQGPTMMVSIPVVFACKHAELTTVSCTAGTAPVGFMENDGHCRELACQKRFINKLRSELQLTGMNCEGSLRRFTMVEPMLKEELVSAGCNPELVEALLNCSQRTSATAKYLGHRALLSSLAEYETSVDNGHADRAHAMELTIDNSVLQHKLVALQSLVFRLSQNSYPAPALKFSREEASKALEQGWGKQQLATLQSTDPAILALPLSKANILAAKSSILSAQNELSQLAQLQTSERASFFRDYPGTDQLHASGAMLSSREMLSEMSSSQGSTTTPQSSGTDVDDDDAQSFGFPPADIRSLRAERVHSKSMAAHKRQCSGLDTAKVHAYSGKSYTALTNPWWGEAKKAA